MKAYTAHITLATTAALLLTGCASTTAQYQKLLDRTPIEIQVPMDYISAFANAKYNYERCVASAGTAYTTTVRSGYGTPVQITNYTPSITVETSLDRQAQIAQIDVYMGSSPWYVIQFVPQNDTLTTVKAFNRPSLKSIQASQNAKITQRLLQDVQSKRERCAYSK